MRVVKPTEELDWNQPRLAAALSFRFQSSDGSCLETCHRCGVWQQLQDLLRAAKGLPLPRIPFPAPGVQGSLQREQSPRERQGKGRCPAISAGRLRL